MKAIAVLAVFVLAAGSVSCSKPRATQAPAARVVIITPSEAMAPREFRGAEALARAYPAKGAKGELSHAILPGKAAPGDKKLKSGDKPGAEISEAAVASFIAGVAADPRVKAIVVDPALPGSAEGFRRAKESRPDLFCVAGGSREDGLAIEASVDLVIDLDRVYRAYLIPWAAKKMGAKALVAVYTRAEDADSLASRERAIMSAACAEFGLKYAAMVPPAGAEATAYARAMTGPWLRDYGPDAALYCSDDALVEPIIAGAIAGGGIVVDAAGSATRAVYAAALGLDLSSAKGDARKERRLLEKAIVDLGAGGRFGLWDADYVEASVEGLGEFALRVALGSARKDDLKELIAALAARFPDAAWLAAYDIDQDTGIKSANRILLREDVYALGTGYLQSALQAVPAKYLVLRASVQ
jgi:hypothetical protein